MSQKQKANKLSSFFFCYKCAKSNESHPWEKQMHEFFKQPSASGYVNSVILVREVIYWFALLKNTLFIFHLVLHKVLIVVLWWFLSSCLSLNKNALRSFGNNQQNYNECSTEEPYFFFMLPFSTFSFLSSSLFRSCCVSQVYIWLYSDFKLMMGIVVWIIGWK